MNYKILRTILALQICLVLCYCANAQVETQTRFVLKGEVASDALLGVPLLVKSFEDGTFLVHEYRTNQIKIFDENGNYIQSISQRGRGPGENLRIEYIFVNNDQQVLIVDEILLRLSIYNNKFDHVKDVKAFEAAPRINSIFEKNNGNYLIHSHQAGIFLFYEWNPNFERTGIRYVPSSEVQVDIEPPLSDPIISNNTTTTLSTFDDLIIAPPFYTGKLLVYQDEQNYETRDIIKTGTYGQPFEIYQGNIQNLGIEEMREELLRTSTGPEGPTAYYHYNRSLGLFTLSSGEILHLVQKWNNEEDRVQLLAEILNPQATAFLGVFEMTNLGDLSVSNHTLEGARNNRINLRFLHMDNNNNLYVAAEDESMEPELHVVNFNFTPN